ncbi:hypothetical protein K7432_007382 [Basidiobolus ranarum]|uniref:Zn(2)-C6 fungal-type domain-containing protein n=1 Tax=Basidiobolus ranarum TaxID=34480 RepID=A0ABR2WTK4_9FUNG
MKKLGENLAVFHADPNCEKWDCISKRRQVKNACINCQNACKKCDEGRPCQRCVKYGLVGTCRNSLRKARRRRPAPYNHQHDTQADIDEGFTIIATKDSFYSSKESEHSLINQHGPSIDCGSATSTPPPSPELNSESSAPRKVSSTSRPLPSYKIALPSPQVSPTNAMFGDVISAKELQQPSPPIVIRQNPYEHGPKLPSIKYLHKSLPSIKEMLYSLD